MNTAKRHRLISIALSLAMSSLLGCTSEREADKQWSHSDLSSYAAAYSQDGRYVLVGDTDAPARLWDIEANKVLYSWQNLPDEAGTTTLVGFSDDSKVAATVEQDTIVLWNMANGKPMLRLDFPVNIKAIDLSKHGDYLFLALYDRTAVYFDVINNRVLKIFEHDGSNVSSPINQLINTVAISPSGKYGLTGGDDRTARLWNLETGDQLRSWSHENTVNIVDFYPKGGFVITGSGNGQTRFWNMVSGEQQYSLRPSLWPKDIPLPNFPSFKSTTTSLDFSPDGAYIVTGHPSQKICLWRTADGSNLDCWQVARRDQLQPGVVLQAVAFSPDGNAVYSESGNGIGQKWRIR
jgi:WD40 repeat protein